MFLKFRSSSDGCPNDIRLRVGSVLDVRLSYGHPTDVMCYVGFNVRETTKGDVFFECCLAI